MSEVVAAGIIEKRRLEDFLNVMATNPSGMEGPLIEEAKLHFNEDGIEVIAVDSANVCMVGPVQFHARGFEHYEAPGSATIAVNLTRLLDRIDPADKDQLIEFEVDMETRHLRLSYGPASVSVALLDPDSVRNEPDVAELDLPNEVVLEASDLKLAETVVEMVSDQITIEGRPDDREVAFYGEGDVDDADVVYGDEDVIAADVNEAVYSIYSGGYIEAITKPIPDESEVCIRFGEEFPLKVDWAAFDGALEVEQTVAPRLEG